MNAQTKQAIFNYFSENDMCLLLESDFDELQRIIDKHEFTSKLIEKAFVAGRSQTSWEQFKKDNDLK